jgi:hypothetical protein
MNRLYGLCRKSLARVHFASALTDGDPCGAEYDASDRIQFTGDVVTGPSLAEPSTWVMMVLGFASYRARKATAALAV